MSRKSEIHYFGSGVPNKTDYNFAETPSGKDANYENFPVGSWLLSRELRSHVSILLKHAKKS